MKTRRGRFGRGCFLVGLVALYLLAGMKLFLAWRDDLWPNWPLGDFLPDGVVRWIFSLESAGLRETAVWLLSRDVVEWAAAACLVLWGLSLLGNTADDRTDSPDDAV